LKNELLTFGIGLGAGIGILWLVAELLPILLVGGGAYLVAHNLERKYKEGK